MKRTEKVALNMNKTNGQWICRRKNYRQRSKWIRWKLRASTANGEHKMNNDQQQCNGKNKRVKQKLRTDEESSSQIDSVAKRNECDSTVGFFHGICAWVQSFSGLMRSRKTKQHLYQPPKTTKVIIFTEMIAKNHKTKTMKTKNKKKNQILLIRLLLAKFVQVCVFIHIFRVLFGPLYGTHFGKHSNASIHICFVVGIVRRLQIFILMETHIPLIQRKTTEDLVI